MLVVRKWPLFAAAALAAMASPIYAQDGIIKTIYHGFPIIGVQPDPTATYDVTIMAPRRALEVIVEGFDLLLQTSPQAADLAALMENGDLVIVYYPGHSRNFASTLGTDLAYFTSRSPFQQGTANDKTFTVVFGRYIVKWGAEEIALTLSHELMGHGIQHLRNRLDSMRSLDTECEAYLIEEDVRQRLGIDKRSEMSVRFRQNLEWKFCVSFKQYMAKYEPDALAVWETLNPSVPTLLGVVAAEDDRWSNQLCGDCHGGENGGAEKYD
ncbi:MAG: hypothetical protein VCD33_09430 [Alphaproteobacteria bacterium]